MSKFTNCIKPLGNGKYLARTLIIKNGAKKYAEKRFYKGAADQNKSAAQEWVHHWERLRSGLPSFHHQPTTLGELAEIYLGDVREDVKSVTHDSYSRLLSNVLSSLGHLHFLHIHQHEIDDYVRQRTNEGAGRTIIKELACLRTALQHVHYVPEWDIPRKLYRIPKQNRYTPTIEEYHHLMVNISPNASLAASMAVFAGLRDSEVYRTRWDHYDDSRGILVVPAAIRKNKVENMVPVVNTLKKELFSLIRVGSTPATGAILDISPSIVRADLQKASDGRITGLQPFRRLLVSQALDCGYDHDSIALVTGHSRHSMTSRYASYEGQMELKRRLLEDVEHRLVA